MLGEQADDRGGAGVCGTDGDPEGGGDLGQGFVLTQVHQGDRGTLVRRELAGAVTLTGDDEHGDPLDQCMREVEYDRMANQRGTRAD